MEREAIQAKVTAYKAELERNVTNRRRDFIASELHRLSALLTESGKNVVKELQDKQEIEIAEIKNDYDAQISSLIEQLNKHKKEADNLKEQNRINKLKAQNLFIKLNAKLTPSEMQLFADALNFIRNAHLRTH